MRYEGFEIIKTGSGFLIKPEDVSCEVIERHPWYLYQGNCFEVDEFYIAQGDQILINVLPNPRCRAVFAVHENGATFFYSLSRRGYKYIGFTPVEYALSAKEGVPLLKTAGIYFYDGVMFFNDRDKRWLCLEGDCKELKRLKELRGIHYAAVATDGETLVLWLGSDIYVLQIPKGETRHFDGIAITNTSSMSLARSHMAVPRAKLIRHFKGGEGKWIKWSGEEGVMKFTTVTSW